MRSPVMTNDENSRQEFKDRTLRRVYDALNAPSKPVKKVNTDEVTVKGLRPQKREEESK
jgi:hypothetical protein